MAVVRRGRACQRGLVVLVVASVVLTFAWGAVSLAHRTARGESDFMGLYRQAELVRTTGSFVNDRAGPYPPSARASYYLWTRLPARVAAAIWFVLAAGLYVGTGWWLVRAASGLPARDRTAVLWVTLAITAPWVGSDLSQGNVSSLLMFSVVGGWLLASLGRPWLAGLTLSLGIIMKPLPLVGLIYLLLKRHWRAAGTTVVCTLILGLVPSLALVGWEATIEGWRVWYQAVGRTHSPLAVPWVIVPQIDYENGSAIASLMRLFRPVRADVDWQITLVELPPWGLALIWYGLAAVLTGPVLWVTRRPASDLPLERQAAELAAYMVLMLWFSPLLMSYYLGITLVPVSVLVWRLVHARHAGGQDRLTLGLLIVFGLSVVHMGSRTLRAAGLTAASLLVLWAALVVNLGRLYACGRPVKTPLLAQPQSSCSSAGTGPDPGPR